MTGQTGDDGTKNVGIMVSLAYLSALWRSLELPLINCEINLILTWSTNCVIASTNVVNENATFAITYTKLYVPIKNETDVILRLSSKMIGNSPALHSGDEANFSHKLLLTNRQVANLRKAFANHTSTDIKLSKAQLSKMQKNGLLRFLAPLLKSGLPLLKSVIKPLRMLGLTAAVMLQ